METTIEDLGIIRQALLTGCALYMVCVSDDGLITISPLNRADTEYPNADRVMSYEELSEVASRMAEKLNWFS